MFNKKTVLLITLLTIFSMTFVISAEEVDPLGKYEPMITVDAARILTSWMTFDSGDDVDNNWYMDTYREQLGININWKWTATNWGTPYEQKINTSMAVNDLPEVMNVYDSILQRLIEADRLMDLTNVYEKYASDDLKELMEANQGLMKKMATVDGKLIAIPTPKSLDVGVVYIRKDWLGNLGLKEPENFEEFERVAEAFANQDPDGNGKDDTYGIAMDKGFGKASQIFNIFHAYNSGWREVRDGESILFNKVHPSQKQVWTKLREWYQKGILDEEFVIKDENKEVISDVVAGRVGIYFGGSNSIADPAIKQQHINNPDSSWIWIPITKLSPDGEPVLTYADPMPGDFNIVTKGAEYPEAMIKMLNLRLAVTGDDKPDWVKSYDYQDTDEGSLSFFMAPVRINYPWMLQGPKMIELAREAYKSGKPIEILPYEARSIYKWLQKYEENQDPAAWVYYELLKEGGTADYREKKLLEEKENPGSVLFIDQAKWLAVPAEGEYGSDLSTRYTEFLTKAVIDGDITGNFEAWVNYYYTNGGTKITEQNNELYQMRK